MKYDTYLFDMDGTVLDTLTDLVDAVNHTLRWGGFAPADREWVREHTGSGAAVLIASCLPQGEATPAYAAVLAEYRAYYAAHPCVKTAPYPGIPELMETLRRRGAQVAIVTNKPEAAALALGQRFFPGIPVLGEREGVARKPAPDMVEQMLRWLGAGKDRAVYVGDSEVDVQTARNSALDLIAVSWGFRTREQLRAEGAQNVVDSCAALLEIVG